MVDDRDRCKQVNVFFWYCNTLGNPGNLLELFLLLEIFWKFAKFTGNIRAEFMCLLLLWLKIELLYFKMYQ